MNENIDWRDDWDQIKTFIEKGTTEIISTGYKKLDDSLGGGLIKGSTNLVTEDSGCIGFIFLVLLLKKRIEFGDIGLIDCFSFSPSQLKEQCKAYNIDLDKCGGRIYYLDFSSKHSVKSVLGSNALDMFAKGYIKVVSNLIPEGDIFNINLSLSASAMRYGDEQIYRHLLREKAIYESYKRTAVYLIERNAHTEEFRNDLKHIFDSVINLNSITHDSKTARFVSIEKSPLPGYFTEKIRYKITPNPGEIIFRRKLEWER